MEIDYPTAWDRLQQRQHSRFVGRAHERGQFMQDILLSSPPSQNIVAYWGMGGVGKSALLDELCKTSEMLHVPVGRATLEVDQDPVAIMRAWRASLEHFSFAEFDRQLGHYRDLEKKIRGAASRMSEGVTKAIDNSGAIGGFLVGAAGEEEIRRLVGKTLAPSEPNDYLEGVATLTAKFARCIADAEAAKVVLMLDHYESATPEVDGWIRRLVVERLPSSTVLLIGGREQLTQVNRRWHELSPILRQSELKPFDEVEMDNYLDRRFITNQTLRADLKSYSGGMPWSLALSADVVLDSAGEISALTTANVRDQFLSRLLEQLDSESPRTREILRVASITTWFDRSIIQAILGGESGEYVDRLARYSFVGRRSDGKWTIKDAVRRALLERLREDEPDTFETLLRGITGYLRDSAARDEPFTQNWSSHMCEWVNVTSMISPLKAIDGVVEILGSLPPHHWESWAAPAILRLSEIKELSGNRYLDFYNACLSLSADDVTHAAELFNRVAQNESAEFWLRAACFAQLVEVAHRGGDLRDAYKLATRGHDLAKSHGALAESALFAARSAEMALSVGNEEDSEMHRAYAREHVGDVENDFVAGEVHLILAYTSAFRGNPEDADEQLVEARARWTRAGYHYGLSQVDSALAWVCWLDDRVSLGLRCGDRALVAFEASHDKYSAGIVALNLAGLNYVRANFKESLSWSQRALGLLEGSGGRLYTAIVLCQMGAALVGDGRAEDAVAYLEASLGLQVGARAEPYWKGVAYRHLARARATLGDPRANSAAEHADELLRRAQTRRAMTEALIRPTYGLAGLGPPDRNRLVGGLRMAEGAPYWDLIALAHLELMRCDILSGDRLTATKHLASAIASSAQHGPYCTAAILRDGRQDWVRLSLEDRKGLVQDVKTLIRGIQRSGPNADEFDRERRRDEVGLHSNVFDEITDILGG